MPRPTLAPQGYAHRSFPNHLLSYLIIPCQYSSHRLQRRKGSISAFTKAMFMRLPGSKRAQRAFQESKTAMKRMSGRETPYEALRRHVVKVG